MSLKGKAAAIGIAELKPWKEPPPSEPATAPDGSESFTHATSLVTLRRLEFVPDEELVTVTLIVVAVA